MFILAFGPFRLFGGSIGMSGVSSVGPFGG
jgi:hypothetical protein